jgi:hypothetical protein
MIVRQCAGKIVATGMMGAKVRAMDNQSVTVKEAIDFSSKGSYFDDLVMVLTTQYPGLKARKADLSTTPGRLPLSKQLEASCSPTKPALCHIAWSKGGHFTMCLGPHRGKLLFADPYYGAVVTSLPSVGTDALIYDTASNSRGVAAATGTIRLAALTG